MTDFFATRMGQRFYEGTVPALVRQLERLNENLERLAVLQPDATDRAALLARAERHEEQAALLRRMAQKAEQ